MTENFASSTGWISRLVHTARLLASALFFTGCGTLPNYTEAEGPRYSASYATQRVSAGGPLKVVSFNIRFGEAIDAAIDELTHKAALSQADVILLQEMDATGVDRVARALGLAYVYYPASVHTNGRDFGNAVLTPWSITGDRKVLLPHESPANGQRRIAVETTIATDRGTIRAYSVHLETPWLGLRGRLDQARTVLEEAVALGGPLVIAGDFNTGDPGSLDQTRALFENAGFVWASRGVGATSSGLFETALDHVFTRGLEPLQSGKEVTRASDHLPVWVDLRLPGAS